MRFPDLLRDVQRLHEVIAILGVDLRALNGELHQVKRALAAAYPPAAQHFRTPTGAQMDSFDYLDVSRETEVSSDGSQADS